MAWFVVGRVILKECIPGSFLTPFGTAEFDVTSVPGGHLHECIPGSFFSSFGTAEFDVTAVSGDFHSPFVYIHMELQLSLK